MRKGWTICLLTILCASMAGCNQMGAKQSASSAYEQVRNQFSTQQAYQFYGRTKLLTASSSNQNVVTFSGRKDGDAVYMNVKLSAPEQNRVDTLSLLHHGEKLYAKEGSMQKWEKVQGQDSVVLQQELNNWDPVFSFRQMDEMKKNVVQVADDNPKDDVESVRVVLDSAKLKSWLASQIKEQSEGAHTQSLTRHQPKWKYAMTLSDDHRKRQQDGASIQAAAPNVAEIVDQMQLDADYTIYYRKSTKLPTSLVMSIRSKYNLNNQRVQEHSQVETFLQNYGQAKPMPRPHESGT